MNFEPIKVDLSNFPEFKNDVIYSNLDHSLDMKLLEEAQKTGDAYQHSAWNFCGYISFKDGEWTEEIWRYNSLVETLKGKNLMDLISTANKKYGSD